MKYIFAIGNVLVLFFKKLPENILRLSSKAISFLILFMIISLIVFAFSKAVGIYQGFSNYSPGNVLHDTALLIVIIKAYKVLLYYYRSQQVSLKYIVEISIIAPAIEIAFAAGEQALWLTVLLAAYGTANLVIYLLYYEKLALIDSKEFMLGHEQKQENKQEEDKTTA